ncbi:MAG TPA: UDP-3-O-acyl-N-acetylglucosamine deacetylase [Dictyoglomaceae bacterium]|nr:UDP-3-O-acyl-N-acetylglucosamine deacetylase [Dictyoglomaceae bacterium]
MSKQKTIKKLVSLEGRGLHTGEYAKIILHPAPVNTGIKFIKDGLEIPAKADFVVETNRRVILGRDGKNIVTIEHLLSAIYAVSISNLLIEVEGEEIPILDGSSLPWVNLLKQAGIKEQKVPKDVLEIDRVFSFREGRGEILIFPSELFRIISLISFPNTIIKWQKFDFQNLQDYEKEIAPARTFGFYSEVEDLMREGLIKGGDLDNALLINEDGFVNTPRFNDEPVRHKILDIIGDFSLLGKELKMEIISLSSGHTLHLKALEFLMEYYYKGGVE